MADPKIIFVDVNSSNLPSLGLGYLAAVLREKFPTANVKIFQKKFINNLAYAIKTEKPDIVGYISFTPYMSELLAVASEIAQDKNIHQIIGGPHITGIPDALPAEMEIGVIGDGEQTICELAEIFKKNNGNFAVNDLQQVDGIVFRDGDKIIKTKPRLPVDSLDSLPLPARDLLNIKGYFPSTIGAFPLEEVNASGILTSRGCPFHCVFCQPSALNKYRFCSVERVIEEMEELIYRYNVNFIQVLEDQLLADKQRFINLAQEIIGRGLNKKAAFLVCARAEQLDDDVCKLLKEMNTKIIGIGFESASDPILKYLKNPICSVEKNQKACDLCKKYDLYIYGSFIFASPPETMADMRKTYDFIKRNFMPMVETQTLTPLPGTRIWDYAKDRGLVNNNMNWNNLILRVREDKNKPWLCENVSQKEFFEFYNQEVWPLVWHYNQTMVELPIKDFFSRQFIKKFRARPKKYLSAFKHTLIHFWRSKILKGKGDYPN